MNRFPIHSPVRSAVAAVLLIFSTVTVAVADDRFASTDQAEVCATDGQPGSAYSRAHRVVHRRPVPGHIIDHAIPICLGGADIEANIVVQTIEEAHEKEARTLRLHRRLPRSPLIAGHRQAWFTGDWHEAMRRELGR